MPGPSPHHKREGDLVPSMTFRMRRNAEWFDIATDGLFGGQSVIVFSLPGAFTPTCSSTHLPRFNELAPVFKRLGIAQVVCIGVNDPFVMEQWAGDEEAANVLMLPDGNGEFTRQMGMLADMSDDNLGQRSWRYSMLVRDRRIEKMFVEPDKPGDPYEVSDADTMLRTIAPDAPLPDQVAVLTRHGCSFCAEAKARLGEAGYDFVEIPLPHATRSKAVGAIAGAQTVPQVFINGERIGGLEQLEVFLAERPDAGHASHASRQPQGRTNREPQRQAASASRAGSYD